MSALPAPGALFAILQKYDFSSKSQLKNWDDSSTLSCLRYCKSTIFQANHNQLGKFLDRHFVVCDTAKVRFFKQITTIEKVSDMSEELFAILQKYDFSSKSQPVTVPTRHSIVVCDTAKVRFFKQITTQRKRTRRALRCLRYCKSTIFQANHNSSFRIAAIAPVVCDTAKVRFFKQITTSFLDSLRVVKLFAILQKYDFSSKSQLKTANNRQVGGCLRYCKSTIFQANHNLHCYYPICYAVVCDTAKVRFFKQITTV